MLVCCTLTAFVQIGVLQRFHYIKGVLGSDPDTKTAVGSKGYVETIKKKLGTLFLSRRVEGKDSVYELREPEGYYRIATNTFPWQ
jgi:hypothetical protein